MTRRKVSSSLASVSEPRRAQHGTSPRWALVLWWIALLAGLAVLLPALPIYWRFFRGVNILIPGAPSSPFSVLSGLASLVTAVTCLGLASLLYRRKRSEPMALFVSFYLIAYGVVMAGPVEFLDWIWPGASDLAVRLIQPAFLAVPTVALLVFFPDGRAVPRWTRWLILVALVSTAILPWAGTQQGTYWVRPSSADVLTWTLMGGAFAAAIFGQAFRYRRVSTPAERQQTKWVLAGFVAWFVLLLVQGVPYAYLGSLPPGTPPPAWASGSAAVWFLALSIIPICLTISILRYRLYEIDIIINRALVYGALTAILAGLYAASISLFQKIFIAATGQQSDAAIVLTTLVLASAFTPLRTRLQTAVDHRFKDVHDPARRLRAVRDEIARGIWILHPQQAAIYVLNEAVEAFGAVGGAAYWGRGRREVELARTGEWKAPGAAVAELAAPEGVIGRIALGPRRDHTAYSAEDRRALDEAVAAVAQGALQSPLAGESTRRSGDARARRPAARRPQRTSHRR